MSATSNTLPLVQSYLFLRKMIGIIGIALPFVLVIGKILLEGKGISDSISSYYYTVMRNVFVGSLCAIAVFLISYRGYDWLDALTADFAGGSAIGVALFPTAPTMGATEQQVRVGWAHLVFAACFFLTLAFFALVLFRKKSENPTDKKELRSKVYFSCGIIIVACLALIVLAQFLPGNSWLQQLHPIFWFESLADVAFGIAWFVKGEGMGVLNDAS